MARVALTFTPRNGVAVTRFDGWAFSDGSHGAFNGELSIQANVAEIGTLNVAANHEVIFITYSVQESGPSFRGAWLRSATHSSLPKSVAMYTYSSAVSRLFIFGVW